MESRIILVFFPLFWRPCSIGARCNPLTTVCLAQKREKNRGRQTLGNFHLITQLRSNELNT